MTSIHHFALQQCPQVAARLHPLHPASTFQPRQRCAACLSRAVWRLRVILLVGLWLRPSLAIQQRASIGPQAPHPCGPCRRTLRARAPTALLHHDHDAEPVRLPPGTKQHTARRRRGAAARSFPPRGSWDVRSGTSNTHQHERRDSHRRKAGGDQAGAGAALVPQSTAESASGQAASAWQIRAALA